MIYQTTTKHILKIWLHAIKFEMSKNTKKMGTELTTVYLIMSYMRKATKLIA